VRLAIVHYHLRAGGVSRIIDLAVKALQTEGYLDGVHQVAVIAGSAPHARSLLDRRCVGVVPELNYSEGCGDVASLGKALDEEARRILGGGPDLWHIHNPTLGKNPMVPMLAAQWAAEGRALVMQIHDFAEQERPGNYRVLRDAALETGRELRKFLYPDHARVRYAVLTSHDAAILSAAGLKRQAVVLPNPVEPLPMERHFDAGVIGAREFVVYPTRAIRRKNIGEAVLWAAQFKRDGLKRGTKLVISLAPEDPSALAEHDLWETFALSHDLPVVFDSVTRFGRPLGDFVAGASASITTSVREGFGMAYLEPWMLGTPVVGRDLPHVTADFKTEGMGFGWLYSGIRADLLPEESKIHAQDRREQREAKSAAYGVEEKHLSQDSLFGDGDNPEPRLVDFGSLSGPLQRRLVARWLGDGFSGIELPDLQLERAAGDVGMMQALVRQGYGLESYGKKLTALYDSAVNSAFNGAGSSGGDDFLDPAAVLAQFLKE